MLNGVNNISPSFPVDVEASKVDLKKEINTVSHGFVDTNLGILCSHDLHEELLNLIHSIIDKVKPRNWKLSIIHELKRNDNNPSIELSKLLSALSPYLDRLDPELPIVQYATRIGGMTKPSSAPDVHLTTDSIEADWARFMRQKCLDWNCRGACSQEFVYKSIVIEQPKPSTESASSFSSSTLVSTESTASSNSSVKQPSSSGNSSTRPTKPTSSGSSVGNDGSGGGGSHSCGDPGCNIDHGKKIETTELPHNPNVCTDENCTIDHNISAPKSTAQSIKKNAVWAWGIFAASALGLIALIVNGIMNKKDESEVSIDLNKISSDNQTQSSINSIQSVIAKQKSLTSPSQQIARKTNSKVIPISSSLSRSPRVNSQAVIQTKNSQKNSQDSNPQNQAA